ncbi:hypothetical protein [Bradyrhizobium erythrophlei]|jgi:hypothetical protein|uniref:Glucosyl transferase GtrII n=1 Tax=Bradyrhizobium erythrophlei TaxID=1437360 RepID=A0A1M5GW85_9BRAD|nr:hypothetical protein [Bradyrhizobium erythrophlei]SHG07970.1 hypothetical protein SAMN05444169_0418 [Bradyrhizobium erythrophlei]
MSWPTVRSGADMLRALVIGTGLVWSVAFVAVGLGYGLELYADGAMFSYAVAAQDVWAFHWHNISGRMSVFFLTLLPAEAYVGLTGNPRAGIVVYGLLFYFAPLAGLIGTFAADRSRGRIIFAYACCSTALLCPLIFGFPTEMWLAHAVFWPALAISHYAKRTTIGTALAFVMMLTLAFTHEGALVLAITIVATLALRGLRDATFLRAAAILIVVLAMAVATKILLRPDEYYAGVFLRAALHFFDFTIFQVAIVVLLFAVLAGYGILFLVLPRLAVDRACLYAAVLVAIVLATYWLRFDHAIHASSRYYLRTVLVIVTPAFGAVAALSAMSGDGRLAFPSSSLTRAMTTLRDRAALPLAAIFMLLTLVHVVETGKFVAAWRDYRAAVTALAIGNESDPVLGDSRFVSSDRIATDLNRLSWFSTTPYLSVALANFAPNRLVIDPAGNYFWLSCATATANAKAARATPEAGRDLIRIYSCLHR